MACIKERLHYLLQIFIPLRKLRRPVVGNGEHGRLDAFELRADDLNLGPTEFLRRRERSVAGEHDPFRVHDDRLLLPEFAEAGFDRVQVFAPVFADVARVERELGDFSRC